MTEAEAGRELEGARVAVVGGGFTGLTAARRLARMGADVTLLEASDRLGGLAAGFELAGHRVEQAYHFLYTTDEHIRGLVDELGLADRLTFHKSSVSTYYGDTLYPMETPLDLLRFKPISFLGRIRAGVTVLWLQKVKDWRRLSGTTALAWLRRYAGREVTDVIWEPLLRGKFDRYYDKVTMSWLWGRVLQRVDSRDSGQGGEVLGYFDGGFRIVVEALEDDLRAAGAEIRLGAPVRRIGREAASDEVVVETDRGRERFDRVLATVPSSVFARMIDDRRADDPAYFDRLESIDYLDAVVHVFASRQKLTPYYWHNVNTPDAPFVVFLSLTNLVGTGHYGGLNIYYIGDYVPREHAYMGMEPEALKSRWYGTLAEMFPEFDRSEVVDDAVFKLRNAQHIVDVGFEENKLTPHETPCEGVYLCNFSQIYPMDRGTNYAVRDGEAMARLLRDGLVERTRARTDPAAAEPVGLHGRGAVEGV